jgi:hypothetical protein
MNTEASPAALVASLLPSGTPEDPCVGLSPAFRLMARAILQQLAPTNPLECLAVAQSILAAHALHPIAHAPLPDTQDPMAVAERQKAIRSASRRCDDAQVQIRRLRRNATKPQPTPKAAPAPRPQPAVHLVRQATVERPRPEFPNASFEALLEGARVVPTRSQNALNVPPSPRHFPLPVKLKRPVGLVVHHSGRTPTSCEGRLDP